MEFQLSKRFPVRSIAFAATLGLAPFCVIRQEGWRGEGDEWDESSLAIHEAGNPFVWGDHLVFACLRLNHHQVKYSYYLGILLEVVYRD